MREEGRLTGRQFDGVEKNIMRQPARFYNKRDALIVGKRAQKSTQFTTRASPRCTGKTDIVIYPRSPVEDVSENPVDAQQRCRNCKLFIRSTAFVCQSFGFLTRVPFASDTVPIKLSLAKQELITIDAERAI